MNSENAIRNASARFTAPWRLVLAFHLCLAVSPHASAAQAASEKNSRGFSYHQEVISEVPWSINIVRIDRSDTNLELTTTLGTGDSIGLHVLSEQVKELPASIGKPLAAVNGDFYRNDNSLYNGDPKGLQIMRGELVSAPGDWSCFWIDPGGQPHLTNVTARFEVVWPDNTATPLGLNEERRRSSAVLYTSRIGATTRTDGGREFVLESVGSGPSLPLHVGETYTVRVREVREGGDSPVAPDRLVLSLAGDLARKLPRIAPGDTLKISTGTFPDLKGVRTAIGGGPALVQGGKLKSWGLFQVRHPRSAIGWNEKYFYLMQVDGRQAGHSVGMTYSELAGYMHEKLGCTEALNLDGGGSATMWLLGQVVNNPSEGRERAMANALVLVQKPEPARTP
jgi:uncharacterized protein YigE (DUF2233 family)